MSGATLKRPRARSSGDRALPCGGRGRTFESCRAHHEESPANARLSLLSDVHRRARGDASERLEKPHCRRQTFQRGGPAGS